jgi:hypothetical protein
MPSRYGYELYFSPEGRKRHACMHYLQFNLHQKVEKRNWLHVLSKLWTYLACSISFQQDSEVQQPFLDSQVYSLHTCIQGQYRGDLKSDDKTVINILQMFCFV